MPTAHPSAITLRLLACAESFARHEDGAVGHDDWPGLVGVLERELALLTRLAREAAAPADGLADRAGALRQRYETLSTRIDSARARADEEIVSLGETTRRIQKVRRTYSSS